MRRFRRCTHSAVHRTRRRRLHRWYMPGARPAARRRSRSSRCPPSPPTDCRIGIVRCTARCSRRCRSKTRSCIQRLPCSCAHLASSTDTPRRCNSSHGIAHRSCSSLHKPSHCRHRVRSSSSSASSMPPWRHSRPRSFAGRSRPNTILRRTRSRTLDRCRTICFGRRTHRRMWCSDWCRQDGARRAVPASPPCICRSPDRQICNIRRHRCRRRHNRRRRYNDPKYIARRPCT